MQMLTSASRDKKCYCFQIFFCVYQWMIPSTKLSYTITPDVEVWSQLVICCLILFMTVPLSCISLVATNFNYR